MSDTRLRSVAKAACWRVCGSSISFCISYAVTGRIIVAGMISGTELLIKPFGYWLHERGWAKVKWGSS